MQIKDYLAYENARNRRWAKLYIRLLEAAWGEQGRKETEMIGHHISFQFDGDIDTMNEIPSADTLIFDHDIMKKKFGEDRALTIMAELALTRVEDRDSLLERYMDMVEVP